MANNISLSTIISIFGRVTRQYPRHVAISRVQYNAVVLALYFWSWAMGSVYGVLKGIAVTIFGLVIPDPNYWCSWLELIAIAMFSWNLFEAAYSLHYSPLKQSQKPRPRASLPGPPASPTPHTLASRRLQGTPKSPVQTSPLPSTPATQRFPALSFTPNASSSSLLDSSRLTTPGSLSRSYSSQLGSSVSTLSSSYSPLSGLRESRSLRALDTRDVDRIIAGL